MTGRSDHDNPFDPRLIAAVVAVGVVAFIALWALVALGPQLSSGNDGGGHALSKAAAGLSFAWQPAQYVARKGFTVWWKPRSRTASVDGAAKAAEAAITPSDNVVNEA